MCVKGTLFRFQDTRRSQASPRFKHFEKPLVPGTEATDAHVFTLHLIDSVLLAVHPRSQLPGHDVKVLRHGRGRPDGVPGAGDGLGAQRRPHRVAVARCSGGDPQTSWNESSRPVTGSFQEIS